MLKLKELRTKSNATQLELSSHLGISRPTYCRYETGEREPNFDTIKKIADYYSVSVDYIIDHDVSNPSVESVATNPVDEQIKERLSRLSEDDKQNLVRYLDFMEKRNATN